MFQKTLIPTLTLGFLSLASSAQAAIVQSTSTFDISNGNPIIPSNATLTRNNDRTLDVDINTNNLPEGAYTMWWVIFNNPNACSEGCGGDDFGTPEVNASAFYADGGVIDGSGNGLFSSNLEENTLPPPEQVLFGNGLADAFQAEIFMIIRHHGLLSSDPEIAELQTTTFNGGCTVTDGDNLFPCQNLQGAVFAAATVPESSNLWGLITLFGLGIFLKRPKF